MIVKRYSVWLFVLIFPLQLLAKNISHEYKIYDNSETKYGTFGEIYNDNSVLNFFVSGSEFHETIYNENGETLEYSLVDTLKKTDIKAIIKDDTVFVEGKQNGKEINSKVSFDKTTWRQSLTYSLSRFSQLDNEEIIFSILRIDNFKPMEMQAFKKGSSTIDVLGFPTEVEHIRVSGTGVITKLWYADYWYRLSDGLMVRCEVVSNPITFDKTVIELINN